MSGNRLRGGRLAAVGLLAGALVTLGMSASTPAGADSTFLGGLSTIKTVSSTVPTNGDVNPYGVAVVPRSVGKLQAGNVLVSNFNNKKNQQGTGRTIVEISPSGALRQFADIHLTAEDGECPGGVGLTTALSVFQSGWVVVGSLPARGGMSANAKAGCLIVLNAQGQVVSTIAGDPINGPWDMTSIDQGDEGALFVTNVLNGTVAANGATVNQGTVVRINLDLDGSRPEVTSEHVIGSGFGERTDPAALVVGPTGVGFGKGVLYVADTVGNSIRGIPSALDLEQPFYGHGLELTHDGALKGPLGLTVAPNNDIITVNSLNGKAVETTPGGSQVSKKTLDSTMAPPALPGAGTLFGLAIAPGGHGLYLVDDGTNTLNLLQ